MQRIFSLADDQHKCRIRHRDMVSHRRRTDAYPNHPNHSSTWDLSNLRHSHANCMEKIANRSEPNPKARRKSHLFLFFALCSAWAELNFKSTTWGGGGLHSPAMFGIPCRTRRHRFRCELFLVLLGSANNDWKLEKKACAPDLEIGTECGSDSTHRCKWLADAGNPCMRCYHIIIIGADIS